MKVVSIAVLVLLVTTWFSCASEQTDDQVLIEYIAHACFRIHSPAGDQLVIDPYGSQIWLGYNFPNDLEADAVLISHPHYDHDGGTSRGAEFPWRDEMRVLRDPGEYAVGEIAIVGVKGKHADPYGMEFGQINTIWVLEVAGIRIAHVGDNGPISEQAIAEMGRVDVLMLPIDGVYHILKQDEIQTILAALQPKAIVPMHYQIPELESAPDRPKDLGPIDPWLEGKTNVKRLEDNSYRLTRGTLPDHPQVVVFRHSPLVTKGDQ